MTEWFNKCMTFVPENFRPMVLIAVVAFSLVLIMLFFILCIVFVNSRPTPIVVKKEPPKTQSATAEKKVEEIKIRNEDIPIISGRLGELLTLGGILHAGPITKIFFEVLQIINESTYDIRWRYHLPFFMLTGAKNSGKSTLLDSLRFEPLTSEENPAINSMWKLFKKGAIFETPNADDGNEEKFWSFLSELFVFIRPRRPLDGIILTVPADMLLLDDSVVEKHAEEVFHRIFAFQREVNFRIPIYLIVTKTDVIDGFSEFAYLLDKSLRQQMFGWSCPYSITTLFSAGWIREIFDTVNAGIRKVTILFAGNKKYSKYLEQAVLFQENFQAIRTSLTKYIYTMFKAHDPKDGLLLRGVYFTGKPQDVICDPNEAMDMVQTASLAPSSFMNSVNNIDAAQDGTVYFINDLFSEKIFKEYNLASPIQIKSIDITRTEYRSKMIFVAGLAVFSVGWFQGNHKIKNKLSEYQSALSATKSAILKVKYLEKNICDQEGQKVINKMTTELLQSMPIVKKLDTMSIFVPQSWLTSLRSDIINAVGLVFDSIVLKTMYIDLHMNTKNILQNNVDEEGEDNSRKDLFHISSFKSFKKLKELVEQISNLEHVSSEYNSVRQMEDRKGIMDLTNNFFKEKFDIAEVMKSHPPSKKLVPPSFDVNKFQNHLQKKVRLTFLAFLSDVFDATLGRILESITADIEALESIAQNPRIVFLSKDLAKLYGKTVLLSDIFKNKNMAWVSHSTFSPTPEYVPLMDELGAMRTVDPKFVGELNQLAKSEFIRFKAKLKAYKTKFTDNVLEENLTAPSESFLAFQKELKLLLDQTFISVIKEQDFKGIIPDDKMLMWDVKKLKELSELINKFYEFFTDVPKDMRPQFFETYKMVAKKCFHPNIKFILAASELLDDIPLGNSQNLLEGAYKRQAINVRNVSASLAKVAQLLDEMQDGDNIKDFGFIDLIISQYLLLLERVDALLSLETPYSSGKALFSNWNGDSNPKFLNISEEEYLQKYMVSQFERIKFLAKELAEPIVDLLLMPNIVDKIKDRKLVNKWKAIIDSINDYEQKKPGNSLAALETFISETLSNVSIDSLDPQGDIKNISKKKGDYFLEKRSEIAQALLSRADIIQYDKAATAYAKIRNEFNEHLGNKFPFTDSTDDISLHDLENFLKMYETASKNLISIFEKNKDSKEINPGAIDFLKKFDSVIPFFNKWIQHSKSTSAADAIVAFNVEMRPNSSAEVLTSSVFDRKFIVSGAVVPDKSNATFFNNDEVKVEFDWVSSSKEKPQSGGIDAKEMKIEDSKVIFSYGGRWAMLRLIEKNKTNKELEYDNGVQVQFNIPIIDSRKGNEILTTKLLLKITPMLKDGDKFSPMVWPIFPKFCPELHIPNAKSENIESDKTSKKLDVNVSFDE